ncbi:MAG: peptidase, partial [Alloprevotella sp.]
RSALAKAPDDSPALRGETFFTDEALSIGLIDGRLTFADAAAEAHRRGTAWRNTARLATQLYKLE